MGFHKVETFPFQKIPKNLLANKTQVTPLRAPGLYLCVGCLASKIHNFNSFHIATYLCILYIINSNYSRLADVFGSYNVLMGAIRCEAAECVISQ